MGYALISNDRAHAVIPVSIKSLQKQMDSAHALCSMMRNHANALGDDSRGGLVIKGLSYSCDHRYKTIATRFGNTVFYLSRDSPFKSDSILKRLEDRTIPLSHIIPDHTLDDPHFSRNNMQYSYMNQKKSLATADEQAENQDPDPEDPEEGSGEAEAEAEAEEDESDLSPAEPSWKQLFQQNVNVEGQDPHDFSNPFSEELITKVEEANNIVKRSTSAKSKTHPVTLIRSPRQVFLSLIFGVLAAVGTETIFGGIDSAKINKVQSDVDNLVSRQKIIIAQLSDNSKEILVNRAFSEGLKNLTFKLAKFVTQEHFITHGLVLYTLIDSEFDKINDALSQYNDIVQAASNNDLHPAVLSHQGSISVFEQIQAQAELQGLFPVINTPQQLSQMRTSFTYTKTGIEIIVTVPLISQDSLFELHRFNPIPISLSPNAYVQLVSDFPIVGLGKKDINQRSLFIELTYADLNECEKLGELFLCSRQRIVKRPNSPSCVYSLYYSDHQMAEQFCQINLRGHKHDQSIETGSNTFLYYSTQSSVYTTNCRNHSVTSHQKIKGPSEINVPSGCKVKTSDFILYPQSELFQEGPHKSYVWSSNPALALLANDTSILVLEDAIKAASKVKGAPPLDPESLQRLTELNKPFYQRDVYGFSAMVIAGVAILLIMTIISIVVYKNYRNNRKANPSIRYRTKKLLGNSETIELLERLTREGSNPIVKST